ncbi:hypothetical protein ACFWIJ_25870 [Streptomyces sp. NPDC127079]
MESPRATSGSRRGRRRARPRRRVLLATSLAVVAVLGATAAGCGAV